MDADGATDTQAIYTPHPSNASSVKTMRQGARGDDTYQPQVGFIKLRRSPSVCLLLGGHVASAAAEHSVSDLLRGRQIARLPIRAPASSV